MTVSNVVNGRMDRVGPEVAQRVRLAIEEMGYRPLRRGRSLRLQREFAICLTILHPDRRFLDDPYITEVAAGMSNFLATVGYGLMINGVRNLADLEATIGRVSSFDALAAMVSGRRAERMQAYRSLSRLHCPMTIIQDTPPPEMDVNAILQDDRGGAFRLARRLLELGVRKIVLVVPRQVWPAVEQRCAGVSEAAKGRAEVTCLTCNEDDHEETIEKISRYLSRNVAPDAIMGANDQIGFAALRALERFGLSVPDAIMVTGFNAFPFRNFSSPLLVSVASPAYEIGQRTGRILYDSAEGNTTRSQRIVFPVRLVDGESAGSQGRGSRWEIGES